MGADAIITAVATIAGAIVGAILAGPVSYFYSKRLVDQANNHNLETNRTAMFNKAAAVFYAALLDDIVFLEDTDPKEISIELLKRASISKRLEQESVDMRHRKAMIMFRPYIDKFDLAGFDAAWSKYHEWILYYGDEKNKGSEYDFKFHLNNLLEYAKPK